MQQIPQQLWQRQWLVWMPLVLTVLANLIVVLFGVALNNRHIDSLRAEMNSLRSEVNARIDAVRAEIAALRAETKQSIAESEFRLTKEILEIKSRVERLEEQRGLIQQP